MVLARCRCSHRVWCPNLSRNGLKVVGPPTAQYRTAFPLARRDYKPSTTTMLMLEDLERMSSSAVYSGEFSQVCICWRLSNSSMIPS